MKVTIEVPDHFEDFDAERVAREVREALAIEGYRNGALTHFQASQLLGLSRFEFDGFLKARNIYDHAYGIEDFEQDLLTLRELDACGSRGA